MRKILKRRFMKDLRARKRSKILYENEIPPWMAWAYVVYCTCTSKMDDTNDSPISGFCSSSFFPSVEINISLPDSLLDAVHCGVIQRNLLFLMSLQQIQPQS